MESKTIEEFQNEIKILQKRRKKIILIKFDRIYPKSDIKAYEQSICKNKPDNKKYLDRSSLIELTKSKVDYKIIQQKVDKFSSIFITDVLDYTCRVLSEINNTMVLDRLNYRTFTILFDYTRNLTENLDFKYRFIIYSNILPFYYQTINKLNMLSREDNFNKSLIDDMREIIKQMRKGLNNDD